LEMLRRIPESFVECKKCPKCSAIMGLDSEKSQFVCGECGFKMPAITRSGIF
jgi:transposase